MIEGVLNSASVIAQTLVSLGVSLPILGYFDDTTYSIGTGSFFGFLSIYLFLLVLINYSLIFNSMYNDILS